MTKKKTETPLNIYQRMNKVQQSVTYVQKNRPSGMKYSIVSHDTVTAKVRPALVENGIIYYPVNLIHEQVGNRTQVTLDLKFCNIHDKEDFMLVSCIGYGIDAQDKGPGKAVSYAVKYGLLKALGLETGDDADNDSIDHKETVEPEKKWQGPILVTALKKALHEFNTDIRAVEDSGTMQALMSSTKDMREQCKFDLPKWHEAMETAIEDAAKRVESSASSFNEDFS